MTDTSATLVVDCRCTLGEGIVWCERRGALFWTDIEGALLWSTDRDGRSRSWTLPDRLGSFGLCESGKLLLGLAKGLAMAEFDDGSRDHAGLTSLRQGYGGPPKRFARRRKPRATDRIEPVAMCDIEPGLHTRINDGRVDRGGNFVFGTMCEDHTSRIGSFYQYSMRHGLRRLGLDHVAIANSICFSPDGGTMYFCDSPTRRIMCCDYEADAARVSSVRIFAELPSDGGFPDGSAIDDEGCLWNAAWGAAIVRRYTPDGHVDREIAVPVKNPSCVTFGGANLDEIFVTTARQQMSAEELERMPTAGSVYRVVLGGARGIPEARVADR